MADHTNTNLRENSLKFKRTLDRIAEKYSKLKYQDGGIEVDLDNIKWNALDHYMDISKQKLKDLESKSRSDWNEESSIRQDVTGTSQLDLTCDDSRADETCISTRELAAEDSSGNPTELEEVSLLDDSRRSSYENELLPEDQDEELQMSLNSHGSSLVELYPSMVSRIERAWHRQHVSDAASLVLKRYRKFRQQPKRSGLNSTFDVTPRHSNKSPKTFSNKNSRSSAKRTSPETSSRCVQQTTILGPHEEQLQQQRSLGKNRALLRRAMPHNVRVMDLSDNAKPREISRNNTFFVGELSPHKQSPLVERVSNKTASSSPSYVTVRDSPFRETRPFLPSHSAESLTCAKETPALKERPDTYGSPVRQSPFKARLMSTLSSSPSAFSRSPKEHSLDCSFKESVKSRSESASLPSTPSRPQVQLWVPRTQSSQCPPQPQLLSPQPARRADTLHRLKRHLSFDSVPRNISPKKVDEDFVKLYHRLVCQSTSAFFNSLPCRLCGRNSESSRGLSSSLEALALSPHRSVLWKRHRVLRDDSYPQSKRLRDECYTYSPGSKRHRQERLRRRLSLSELELPQGAVSFSPSKRRAQQPAGTSEGLDESGRGRFM
ncbi:uncharacterized protein si:dkeyp-117h8.4 isoform X1 [Nothobranchius furzeri]|uniref:Uncharacterized protein n=1 Tax=Nothobranchius furzeri TaxID=105023 RepID=A0A1A8BBI7_NOTFU|nr:uncharacterized protein si:dkeyp-117h8.4 isoform X1 [Nothobranchius furzeri]